MDQSPVRIMFDPVFDMSWFDGRVTINVDTECWEWKGKLKPSGYAPIKRPAGDTIQWAAHRYSFYLYYGYLPHMACHRCNNKKCVNPLHLYDGDLFTNAADSIAAGTQVRGTQVNTCKLSEQDVTDIRSLYRNEKIPHRKLAKMFGVTKSTITSLLNNETWAHL